MRKAKIMLSAIALFAIVGGTLAVKASQARLFHIFYSIDPEDGLCTVPFQTKFTTDVNGVVAPYFTTPTIGSKCLTKIIVDL